MPETGEPSGESPGRRDLETQNGVPESSSRFEDKLLRMGIVCLILVPALSVR
jgi:hypothetical protein